MKSTSTISKGKRKLNTFAFRPLLTVISGRPLLQLWVWSKKVKLVLKRRTREIKENSEAFRTDNESERGKRLLTIEAMY